MCRKPCSFPSFQTFRFIIWSSSHWEVLVVTGGGRAMLAQTRGIAPRPARQLPPGCQLNKEGCGLAARARGTWAERGRDSRGGEVVGGQGEAVQLRSTNGVDQEDMGQWQEWS